MALDEKYPLALPQGTILAGQYVIEQALGQGGFGITYKATDHKTGQSVAVKEFFPDSMASRTTQTTVTAFPGERGESFVYGKGCFLQEAETLAEFIGNENIVRVYSYFEENGTAYFVMEFIEGKSFDQYIKEHGGKVTYEEAEKILLPVIDALALVHAKGIVHRDVTPDNIYITKDGRVKLLDFGAARYSLGDKSRSLDVVLKHGFAPKEQYTRHGRQGPYTDVYTVGASFYFAITGRRPPDSIDRLEEDELIPPSSLGIKIAPDKEDAILKAMSVQPSNRYQTMGEFHRALMSAGETGTQTSASPQSPQEAVLQTSTSPLVQQRVFTVPQPNIEPQNAVTAGVTMPLQEKAPEQDSESLNEETETSDEEEWDEEEWDEEEWENYKIERKEIEKRKRKEKIKYASVIAGIFAIFILVWFIVVNTREFRYETYSDHIEITEYRGKDTEVEIPSEIRGKPVTVIGSDAFSHCTGMTSVTIPDGVTEIGSDAFYYCSSLTSITIPDSVTEIGSDAFALCSSLTSVTIPDGVTEIGSYTFFNCESLTDVIIPDSVTEIGSDAFALCSSLTSITIPNSVTEIGENAFDNCRSLTNVIIPDGVTKIGGGAFFSCYSLTSVTIPEHTTVADDAFIGCHNVTVTRVSSTAGMK